MEHYGMNDSADFRRSADQYLEDIWRRRIEFNVNEALWRLPPLGLRLTQTPSFLARLEQVRINQLNRLNNRHNMTDNMTDNAYTAMAATPMPNDYIFQHTNMSKLKAENFMMSSITIGSWERKSKNEGDLVAKCYFAKKKLVWEVLESGLKSKIEVQWSDISAFKATVQEGEPGTLQIELSQPPLFYHEVDPQPRKHTQWKMVSDFTGGQASNNRRHILKFPPGSLDRPLEKLLRSDKRLHQFNRQDFPESNSPYFPPPSVADFVLNFGGQLQISPPRIDQQQQQPLLSFARTPDQMYGPPPLDSPIPEYGSSQTSFLDQIARINNFGDNHFIANQIGGSRMPFNATVSSLLRVPFRSNYIPYPENQFRRFAFMQQQGQEPEQQQQQEQQEQQQQQQPPMLRTVNDEYQQNMLSNNNSQTVVPNSMVTPGGNILENPNRGDNGALLNNNNLPTDIFDPQLYVQLMNMTTDNGSFSSSGNNSDGNQEGNYWL
ncbi:hypothetical protein J1N35_023504 [Gossypium stocksii]|uniref:TRF2/HOY1 PH-like domain-containing protein n=1 Tax=Gossypium stocksii TaxID=47602 RepID=A0A9D3VIQ4_9ROSI|nr:hypothetical protein J1N35_023504 [Gossypium stocksii]